MTKDITIAMPTVTGREETLEKCLASYKANTQATYEVLIYKDQPGVAFGWHRGAEDGHGRYIHMSSDDVEPLPGWDEAAIDMVEEDGCQPGPLLWNPDGTPWRPHPDIDPHTHPDRTRVPLSTMPFLKREWWKCVTPLPPGMHYFVDNYVSIRLAKVGIETAVCKEYGFRHHWAQEHRGAGWSEGERMAIDEQYVNLVLAVCERGEAALRERG